MSWWLIDDFGMPLYLERYCGSSFSALDIAARFVSSSDAVRMRNFCSAIARTPTVSFDVIGMDVAFQVKSDSQSNVVIAISPKELRAIDEGSAARLASFIEQRLGDCPSVESGHGHGRKISITPEDVVSRDDGDLLPIRVVLSGVQSFPDLNPGNSISANLALLNSDYAFKGVRYLQARVRLNADPSIGLGVVPMAGWGGGGVLEKGLYLICWAQHPGSGGQQLTGGYTACILASIPTASSEAGLERSPHVWGEVQLNDLTTLNPVSGISYTPESAVGILDRFIKWSRCAMKKRTTGTTPKAPDH